MVDAVALFGDDYGLVPSDVTDQTSELQAAFAAASSAQRTLIIRRGPYRFTGPIDMGDYPNLHVIGAGGTSFGTRFIAVDSAGFNFDGGAGFTVFHSSFSEVMFEREGADSSYMLRFAGAYSMRFHNCRLQKDDNVWTTAAIWFEESNNDILFENLVCQFNGTDNRQPVGILFGDNCGTIRFIKPDIEDCARNIKWNGGKVEIYAPYMETAAAYSYHLEPDPADDTAYFKVYGGECGHAAAAVGVGVFDECHDVDFFGTAIYGASTAQDIYVEGGTNVRNVNFWGCQVDSTKIGGVAAYAHIIGLHGRRLVGSKTHDWGNIAAAGFETTTVTVTGAKLGHHTARAHMSIDTAGLILFPWVSADDTVSVTAFNPTGSGINLASATLYAMADTAPRA